VEIESSATNESAALKAANKTAQAILSGKYNKKLKEENLDDFIEVYCEQTFKSLFRLLMYGLN